MKTDLSIKAAFGAAVLFIGAMSCTTAATLRLVNGDLSQTDQACAVSDDGRVAVGSIQIGSSAPQPSLFEAGVAKSLGALQMNVPSNGVARGVSADGSVVVGHVNNANGATEAFVWKKATGMMTGLGDINGGAFESFAYGVSSDGSIIVGNGKNSGSNTEGVYWLLGILTEMGDLPGGVFLSTALGVSGDGLVAVGLSSSPDGIQAARASNIGVWEGLGYLPGDGNSTAEAASQDGSVIVGASSSIGSGNHAFRWTQTGGMAGLGDLPGGQMDSGAFDVSADGGIVVGYGSDEKGNRAMIWNEARGLQHLEAVLARGGANLTGWALTEARGISADGRTIVGNGTYQGMKKGWVATITLADLAPLSPPVVVIGGKKKVTTTKTKLTVKGTSKGAGRVLYRVGTKGAFRRARGTTNWNLKAKLKPGRNKVYVKAVTPSYPLNPVMESAPVRLTIVRK